jgi:type II secretory pathway component PulJ
MNPKHHGYALTEMLVIIVVLMVLMSLSVRPMRTLISEIPHSARVCQTLNTTTKALEQLKNDIEQANHIRGFKEGVLALEQNDGPVSYTLADGQITRRPGLQPSDAEYTWHLPDVKIETHLWNQGIQPCGVELTTWNQQKNLGRDDVRFKQTVVFFKKGQQP